MGVNIQGFVNSYESFGAVDGPGIRFVVFLSGCPLRCRYCHNPETWATQGSSTGVDEVLKRALRYRSYWKGGGGITVSGGEPMLQAEFVTELFRRAKADGVTTCLDTSGAVFSRSPESLSKIDSLLQVTDLVLLDIKHIDSKKHEELTGKGNENILDFAKYLSEKNIPVWIRHVLVPGINDDEESLKSLGHFIQGLKNVERIQVLPYHSMAINKYKELGLPYSLQQTPEPDSAAVERAMDILGAGG